MDNLKGISSFVKAVEEGSIAAGARRLGISAAAASQNIARLEQQLGVRLLIRTTRSLALTESGQLYYQRVQSVMEELDDAQAELHELAGEPRGKLRIASSAAFGRNVLAPLVAAFAIRYPKLKIELVLADHYVDHIREEIDLSIRFSQQLEAGLVARRIARVPLRFCASPAYLAQHGTPHDPDELIHHQCLVLRVPFDGRLLGWRFVRNGLRFEAPLNDTLICNDIDTLANMAAAGAGIARIGAFVADRLIADGLLVPLFEPLEGKVPNAEIEPLEFYACYRDRQAATGKLRLLIDFLVTHIPSPWQA